MATKIPYTEKRYAEDKEWLRRVNSRLSEEEIMSSSRTAEKKELLSVNINGRPYHASLTGREDVRLSIDGCFDGRANLAFEEIYFRVIKNVELHEAMQRGEITDKQFGEKVVDITDIVKKYYVVNEEPSLFPGILEDAGAKHECDKYNLGIGQKEKRKTG